MTQSKCLSDLLAYAKETLPEATQRTLVAMDERFQRIKAENPKLSAAEIQSVIHMLVENEQLKVAARNRAARLLNLEVQSKGLELVTDYSTGQDLGNNALALISGTSSKKIIGGNRGILAVAKGIEGRFKGQFLFAVEKHLPMLRKGALNRELTLELGGVSSGSPAAKEVAGMFNKIMTKLFDMKKSVNPYLERIDNYFHRQSHDADKIRAVGFSKWADSIKETHGNKSFEGLLQPDIDKRLLEIYDAIINDDYSSSFLRDPANKQRQMARERQLLPNDAEAFYKYHSTFGKGSVFDVMLDTITRASRDVAVMERLGAKPLENAKKIFNKALATADEKQKLSYTKLEDRINANLQEALGFSYAPAIGLKAKAIKFLLQAQTFAKLPFVYLTLTDDLVRAMGILQSTTGKNPISTIGSLTNHYIKSFISPKYAKELAQYVWLYADSYMGKISSEVGMIEHNPGVMGKLNQMMSQVNFSDLHHRSAQSSVAITMAKALADQAKLPYANIDPVFREQGLYRYGIKEPEWKLITRARETMELEDIKRPFDLEIITPEGVEKIPDSAVIHYLRETKRLKEGVDATRDQIEGVKQRLSNTIGGILNDMAMAGSSTPGISEKAYLLRGKNINSGMGQLLRLVSQFGGAQLKNLNTTARIANSPAGEGSYNFKGTAILGVGGVVAYAMREWARSAAVGETPDDPSELSFILGAAVSAVGAGPFVDSMVYTAQQDASPYMKTGLFAKALLGPNINDLMNVGVLGGTAYNALFDDHPSNDGSAVLSQALRLAEASPFGAPFKLPYTKTVANYFLLNELRQAADPRYLRKQEKKMQKAGGILTEEGLWPEKDYFMLDPRY